MNPHGNTIELAFTNIAFAETTFEDHVATSSDHFTLSLTLPGIRPAPMELDELASSLVDLLTLAAKAAGRPTRKGGRPAPWWTEGCVGAAAAFRATRRGYPLGFNQDVQISRRDFHHVVRRAKRQYCRDLIDCFSKTWMDKANAL